MKGLVGARRRSHKRLGLCPLEGVLTAAVCERFAAVTAMGSSGVTNLATAVK